MIFFRECCNCGSTKIDWKPKKRRAGATQFFLPYFFLFYFFISIYSAFSQSPEVKFKHLSPIDGISHSFTRRVFQDHLGFIWIATIDGLNKYDGYSITVYKGEPSQKNSLIHNDTWELFEDSKHRFWIGTRYGLCQYIREKDNFLRDSVIGPKFIQNILEDSNKDLWVNAGEKLYKFDEKGKVFKEYKVTGLKEKTTFIFEDSDRTFWMGTKDAVYNLDRKTATAIARPDIPNKDVYTVYEDKSHHLWLGALVKGLITYNIKTKKSTVFKDTGNSHIPPALYSTRVNSITEDEMGKVWMGTENFGLVIYDPKVNEFYTYLNDQSDKESLSFNSIYSVFKDRDKIMWLATFSGVDILKKVKFSHFAHQVGKKNSLNNNNILSFLEDKDGDIWLGTDGGGLNRFERKANSFTAYTSDPKNPHSIGSHAVMCLKEDKEGRIWMGTWSGGLELFDKRTGRFRKFLTDKSNPESIKANDVVNIFEDSKSRFWVGTVDGLDLLDRKTGKFTHYSNDENKIYGWISEIYEDREENLWIATYSGVHVVDHKTGKTGHYFHEDNDPTTIGSDVVFSIFQDRKGNVWIGTSAGLNLYNKKSNSFSSYTKKDGLPSDPVLNFIEDKDGFLWLGTGNGISRFNPEKKTFKNFTISDGLQGNEFKETAYLKTKSGDIYYGGANGFNIFNPADIKDDTVPPSVVITELKIFNRTITIGKEGSPLKNHITCTKELTLSYKESVFSLDFAALHFTAPEKNQYAYKLEGFEKEWNYVGEKRTATYTNLDPGTYLFRVRASNNDGYWSPEGATLKIIITPPFWQTWWFRVLIGALIVAVALLIHKIRIGIIQAQKLVLERQVIERTAQISSQKEELAFQAENLIKQGEKLEKVYVEIKDSIRAAKVIQQSILPSSDTIKQYLPESFILNKPKDVVSGDFYWFDVKDGNIIIAAVDCTGHGVSGAFMSINGHHLLNQSIFQHTGAVASKILDRLHEGVVNTLHQSTDPILRDGMDISLCIIDLQEMKLQFAGANSPLYLIRGSELIQVKGNKYSIGFSVGHAKVKFNNHFLDLKKGDTFYLFSDGYADQFGGKNGEEKFLYTRFRQLLQSINKYDMDKQKEILENTLNKWKGDTDQIDDILVMGFKIP